MNSMDLSRGDCALTIARKDLWVVTKKTCLYWNDRTLSNSGDRSKFTILIWERKFK